MKKRATGERWVRTDPETGEMFVREKWTWLNPGAAKKVGWDVAANEWHASEGPWGAPNVAQRHRPQPHVVGAFQRPEDQAAEVVKLLTKAISDRVKELSKKKAATAAANLTDYEKLIDSIKKLRVSIASDATTALQDIEQDLAKGLGEVFPNYGRYL